MSKFTNFTIVYVFGPEQCEDKYFLDQIISLKDNEWVKIGETKPFESDLDTLLANPELIIKSAMKRIKEESRTGIPFPSKIYDLFIFPYKNKTDNKIRTRLCQDMFIIDNSKQMNRERRENQLCIPAGQEFVYNVQRSKIKYAVQSIDHDLISNEEMDEEQLNQIIRLCRFNDINLDNNAEESEKERETGTRKKNLDLDLVFADVENAEVVLKNGKGEEVVDKEGVPVTAFYVGDNKFDCRGEIARTSPLAKKYLNEFAGMDLKTVNGNEYWYYNGQKLTALRKN